MTAPAGFIADAPEGFEPEEAAPAPSWGRRFVDTFKSTVGEGMKAADDPSKLGFLYDLHAVPPESASISGRTTGQKIAQAVVPSTPIGVGAMAGTAAAKPLVGLAARVGLPVSLLESAPWLARVLGGAFGGEIGGQASGERTGTGALEGGGGALVGEAVGAGVPAGIRATGWGRRAIARADATRVGGAMSEVAPTLKPGTTAGAMQRTAEGQGLERLGQAKEASTQATEAAIAKGQPGSFVPPGEIPMPSLAYRELVGTAPASPTRAVTQPTLEGAGVSVGAERPIQRGVYGEETVSLPSATVTPGRVAHQPTGEREFLSHEGTQIDALTPIFSGKSTWTLRDANAALSEIGDMMRGRKPLDPRFKDVDLGKLYGQIVIDMKQGIAQVGSPEAAAAFGQGQAEYRAGRSGVLPLLERPAAFKQGEFNVQDLQRWLTKPANRADLAQALGGDLRTGENLGPYNKLVDAITRGAGAGMVDSMSSKPLGLLSDRGSHGFWAPAARVIGKFFPNSQSQYVGRVPYSAPESVRTLLDLMAERGAEGVAR